MWIQTVRRAVLEIIKLGPCAGTRGRCRHSRLTDQVEPALAADQHRILVAIDEVERFQTGLDEGWTTPGFLDFVRAAGDQLSHIRLMLVSAHPLQRLGATWNDRLISAIQRRIGPLTEAHARELLVEPVPDFPDIWPPAAVDRVVRMTAGQPYLLQFVGNAVVQVLNSERRFKASEADVAHALDRCLLDSGLFDDLWNERRPDERRLLRLLAGHSEAEAFIAQPVPADLGPAAAWLHREAFLADDAQGTRIAVPLFATWIRTYATD
jgi:hypothetical protein